MVASGVGQFSINVKSNLKDFYGELTKSQRTLKELTDRKNQLNIDSSKLTELRDKAQRIAAEMKELRQQKTEIKLGTREVDDAKAELKNLDQQIASLNRQKLEVEADIQPIRTANVELYKTEQEIDRINGQKVSIDFSQAGDNLVSFGDRLDGLGDKVVGVVKKLATLGTAGVAAIGKVAKDAVNEASDLEQNTGGVQKLYGGSADKVIEDSKQAYKTAGLSINEYMEQSTTFAASLIKNLGGNQEEAAKYANEAIVDMSDNVNTFGGDIGLIQNAYQGFAKGNYTMLDNLKLGFAGSQQGAIDLVNSYGGLDKKVTDISQVTMPIMIKAVHNAQEAMHVAGTTSREAATTYEGSLNSMKSAWKNFLATGDAKGLAETVPIYFDNLDKKLKELTPKIIEGIKTLVKELPPKIKPVIKDIQNILTQSLDEIFGKGFTKNFTDGMKPFTNTIKTIFDTLSKSSNGKKPDLSWMGSVIPDLLKVAVGLKVAGVAFKGVGGLLKGVGFIQNLGFKLPSFKGLSGFTKSTKEIKQIGVNDLKSLGMKMLTIAGISANIYLAAKALEEVQKVGDLKGLQPKLLAIAEAVVGMGVLAAAAGFIAEKKPDLLISGLIAVAGISGTIYLAAKALQEVSKVDGDFWGLQAKIGQIAASITEIGVLAAVIGLVMDTGVGAEVIIAGLLGIIGIAGAMWLTAWELRKMQDIELDRKKISSNIKEIKNSISDLVGDNIFKTLGEMVEDAVALVKGIIDAGLVGIYVGLGNELTALQNVTLDSKKIGSNISSIKTAIGSLSSEGIGKTLLDGVKDTAELVKSVVDLGLVGAYIGIGNELEALQNITLDNKKIGSNIKDIKKAIGTLSGGGENDSWWGKIASAGKSMLDTVTSAADMIKGVFDSGLVATYLSIADELEDLQGRSLIGINLTNDEGTGEIDIIQTAISKISGFKFKSGSGVDGMKTAFDMFTEMSKIADVLEDLQGRSLMEDSLLDEIGIIKSAVMSISSFSTGEIANNLTGLADALDRVINDLTKTYPPEFQDLGKLLAQKTNEGFKSKLDLQSILSSKVKSLSAAGASGIGSSIAKAISSGFDQSLNLGDKIHNSIIKALSSEYSAKINVDLLTNKVDNSKSPSTKYPTVVMASGGRVPTDSQLQDSPEKPVLGNGEYVIPKKIVNALGVPFFDKLRSGQISRTFAGLAQSVSNTTSSVVNNIYNTTNNHQNMTVYAGAGQDVQMIANRRLRR